jgi:phosphoribosyl-ATP pyrophosphohydrolase/phosphoribosyl-AMP cyclohydrolase/histidinol dehydrogenase
MLRVVTVDELARRGGGVDAKTLSEAAQIVADVREGGESAVRRYGERFGELVAAQPIVHEPAALRAALARLDSATRGVLERSAERITSFARAQRACLTSLDVAVEGGRAGHGVAPMDRAGCYAPGGRFPLPSSVLMTACTARVAGVGEVWVASPKPTDATLAAAAIAGADGVLGIGGAHAIAALAYGVKGVAPACDIVVGPGNRWVTAAKKIVFGDVAIDMLAGPSEVVVLADESADATRVAADLLAQAEHDTDARAILVTTSRELAEQVNAEIRAEVARWPASSDNASIAREALARNSGVVLCESLDDAIAVCDRIAPEHLEVMTRGAKTVGARLSHYGGLFIGGESAEVLGDYAMGPNHVLPTGGTARFAGGLSVFTFLRVRTWLQADRGSSRRVAEDAAALGRIEGLLGHARAAELRIHECFSPAR